MTDHLRTLLHRNDTMGMSASIEARFPFLDENLAATAINLPYRFKIRFAPDVWEKDHPFLRDKWVMRKVADRYLPNVLSQREKKGFIVSAFRRMTIDPDFFHASFVADQFKLNGREMAFLLDGADTRLKVKLMMLESWGRIFIHGAEPDTVREDLTRHARIANPRQ
jgi:asparagine synthase (glutamine-hydrolysing)